MKFCEKCGHQLLDEAVICTGCGCMVEGYRSLDQTMKKAKKGKTGKTGIVLDVFNFVFSILSVLCLFFILLSFLYPWGMSRGYFDANDDLGIVALVFAGVALAFAIVSFILSLVKKVDEEKVFSSIIRLLIGALLLIISIIIIC